MHRRESAAFVLTSLFLLHLSYILFGLAFVIWQLMGMVEAVTRHPAMQARKINLREKAVTKNTTVPQSAVRKTSASQKTGGKGGVLAPVSGGGGSKTSFLIDIPLLSTSMYWWSDHAKVSKADRTSATYG